VGSAVAYVDPPTMNQAPNVDSPTAGASTVTTTNTTLGVQASDERPESTLTYLWSIVSAPYAGGAYFSVNDSNAAKNTTVTFYAAGNYTFRVTVTDAGGLSATRDVDVNVQQTFTGINITPHDAAVLTGTTRQFAAAAIDQFGNEITNYQSSVNWAVDGGVGSIGSNGLYTAPPTGNDTSFTVSASSNGKTGWANVAVKRNDNGLYIGSDGLVYVQATDVNRVKIFTTDGTLTGTLPMGGPFPQGMTFRSAAKIYLADGSYLDASQITLVRRDAGGSVIQTYIPSHAPPWTGLALDPDGTSFWADDESCYLYHFDIATGKSIWTCLRARTLGDLAS
jgi:K319-like protein